MDNSRVFMLKRKMNTWCTLLIPSQQSPRSSWYSSAYPWKPWRFCPSDDGEYETKSSIMNRILCLYPLAKHPTPLAENLYFVVLYQGYTHWQCEHYTQWKIGVFGLQTRAIAIFHLNLGSWWFLDKPRASLLRDEGLWLRVDRWWLIDIVGVEYLFYLWIMCNLWFLAVF